MIETIKYVLAIIGAYNVIAFLVRIAFFVMDDRSGNSGRYKHWEQEDD